MKVGEYQSKPREFHFGVPQGSVLGPLLYTSLLAELIRARGISVNLNNEAEMHVATAKLEECTAAISTWITMQRLKLNAEKTELVAFRSKSRTKPASRVQMYLGDIVIILSSSAHNIL